eukprot:scaffold1.g5601.t1
MGMSGEQVFQQADVLDDAGGAGASGRPAKLVGPPVPLHDGEHVPAVLASLRGLRMGEEPPDQALEEEAARYAARRGSGAPPSSSLPAGAGGGRGGAGGRPYGAHPQAVVAEQQVVAAYVQGGFPMAAYPMSACGFQPVVLYSYPPGGMGPGGMARAGMGAAPPPYSSAYMQPYVPAAYMVRPAGVPVPAGVAAGGQGSAQGWAGAPLAPMSVLPASLSSPRSPGQQPLPDPLGRDGAWGAPGFDAAAAAEPLAPAQAVSAAPARAGLGAMRAMPAHDSGSAAGVAPGADAAGAGGSGGGRRARERPACAFFLKTGTCAWGDRCKFEHPHDKAPHVEFNSLGLPLRPGEPNCAFYVKHYTCAFGHTCKFHHPELPGMAVAQAALPAAARMAMGAVFPQALPPASADMLFSPPACVPVPLALPPGARGAHMQRMPPQAVAAAAADPAVVGMQHSGVAGGHASSPSVLAPGAAGSGGAAATPPSASGEQAAAPPAAQQQPAASVPAPASQFVVSLAFGAPQQQAGSPQHGEAATGGSGAPSDVAPAPEWEAGAATGLEEKVPLQQAGSARDDSALEIHQIADAQGAGAVPEGMAAPAAATGTE